MEIIYIVFVGVLSFVIDDVDFIREVTGSLKMLEFYLIPLVQCKTSAQIKRYIESKEK
jgi:hypothetical protein